MLDRVSKKFVKPRAMKRQPAFDGDNVRMPLSGVGVNFGKFATITRAQFDRIMAGELFGPVGFGAALTPNWRSHVCKSNPAGAVQCGHAYAGGNGSDGTSVARVLAGLGPKKFDRREVHFINGNRYDLRPENLEIRDLDLNPFQKAAQRVHERKAETIKAEDALGLALTDEEQATARANVEAAKTRLAKAEKALEKLRAKAEGNLEAAA